MIKTMIYLNRQTLGSIIGFIDNSPNKKRVTACNGTPVKSFNT